MKIFPLAALLWVLTIGGAAAQDSNWHLLTKSRSGTISLLHGLDERTCQYVRARALGKPATAEEAQAEQDRWKRENPSCPPEPYTKDGWSEWRDKNPMAQGCTYEGGATSWGWGRPMLPGDIESAECFK